MVYSGVGHAPPRNAASLVATGFIVMVEFAHFNRDEEEFPMTEDRLLIEELAAKGGQPDFLRTIAESVLAFLKRPLTGEWPYLWLDATYLKVREGGRIISVAAIIAMAVNTEGRREIVGLHIGPSEAEVFWSDFLKDLVRRGLTGVKLVISDAHEGLKGAITRVMGATWQRCRVHFMRNALSYVPKGQNTVVAAAIRQVFLPPDQKSATQVWRQVADQLRTRWPKLGACMDEAETDVLAYTGFPNEDSIVRLVGAVLLEQNDEWQLQHRYMQIEGMAELNQPIMIEEENQPLHITTKAA